MSGTVWQIGKAVKTTVSMAEFSECFHNTMKTQEKKDLFLISFVNQMQNIFYFTFP